MNETMIALAFRLDEWGICGTIVDQAKQIEEGRNVFLVVSPCLSRAGFVW